MKRNHFCLDCRKQDAYTFAGHSYCYECNEKRNAKAREYRAANREQTNARRMERYGQKKSDFRCVFCGRPLDLLDRTVTCHRCNARRSNRFAMTYERQRLPGMCHQCCKAPPLPGKKLCQSCYDKNLPTLQKMWDARKHAEPTV